MHQRGLRPRGVPRHRQYSILRFARHSRHPQPLSTSHKNRGRYETDRFIWNRPPRLLFISGHSFRLVSWVASRAASVAQRQVWPGRVSPNHAHRRCSARLAQSPRCAATDFRNGARHKKDSHGISARPVERGLHPPLEGQSRVFSFIESRYRTTFCCLPPWAFAAGRILPGAMRGALRTIRVSARSKQKGSATMGYENNKPPQEFKFKKGVSGNPQGGCGEQRDQDHFHSRFDSRVSPAMCVSPRAHNEIRFARLVSPPIANREEGRGDGVGAAVAGASHGNCRRYLCWLRRQRLCLRRRHLYRKVCWRSC